MLHQDITNVFTMNQMNTKPSVVVFRMLYANKQQDITGFQFLLKLCCFG